MSETTKNKTKTSSRDRIVRAAAELLAEGGRDAVTTRAVAAAAGVQAPTIYRQFGDMRGLLDEVASQGFAAYLRKKTSREREEDPVEELRRGWDLHIEFGLANPALYVLMYGNPRPGAESTAALAASEILHGLMQRVAEAGRLRIDVEHAAQMSYAAGIGVTLTLLGSAPEDRDPALSHATREAILGAITMDETDEATTKDHGPWRVANRAVALKAILPEARVALTPGERALLSEWLGRVADTAR